MMAFQVLAEIHVSSTYKGRNESNTRMSDTSAFDSQQTDSNSEQFQIFYHNFFKFQSQLG